MAYIEAPYDPFPFITQLAILFESLSPEINKWIADTQDARKQHIFTMRVKACKRYCRRNKLTMPFISIWVSECFQDQPADNQIKLAQLIAFQLGVK